MLVGEALGYPILAALVDPRTQVHHHEGSAQFYEKSTITDRAQSVPWWCLRRAHGRGEKNYCTVVLWATNTSTSEARFFPCLRRAHPGEHAPSTNMFVLVRFPPSEKAVVANLGRLESCRTAPMGVPKSGLLREELHEVRVVPVGDRAEPRDRARPLS